MKVYDYQAGWYFFINDHLGTPQKIVNSAGEVMWAGFYQPFGKAWAYPATVTNNFRFPGQYYDAETGLYYNWNRYYDPDTGRYITADPIGLEGGVNLYAYVMGNPVNLTDPEGLKPVFEDEYDEFHNFEEQVRFIRRLAMEGILNMAASFFMMPMMTVPPTGANACKSITNSKKGFGNIGSHGSMDAGKALAAGEKWLGKGYKEVGPKGSGVFRSADGTRQFRMTASDLDSSGHGAKSGLGSHIHFESLDSHGNIVENLHISITP